ncbi:MFS transporter [Ornithinimicrobium sp. W1665]|uniref:MFS transporter n=1 Tax=Ornithinimicrobium sp. W1665 TaxID=3416666 RepID=UPI003D6C677E
MATFAQLYSPQGVLPQIATDLGTTADRAALAVSAATLGLALAVVPWSFVGDRYGRLRAMVAAVVGATVLGLASAWAPTFELVLLMRLLEGAFLGGVPALAMAYLNDEVDARSAAVAAGWFVGGTTVGGLIGRLVATPVADLTSWRMGMTTVSAMAAVAAVGFVLRRRASVGSSASAARRSSTAPGGC